MKVNRILIMGIGGIGGLVAGALVKEGYSVTLVTNNDKITDAINSRGIVIRRNNQEVSFYCQSHTELTSSATSVKYEIIFLIMKANHLIEAVEKSKRYLNENGYFATFQNGIVEYKISELMGKNKVVPVTVGFGGSMIEAGLYEKTSPGGFHIGEISGEKTKRILKLKEILSNVAEVKVSTNMEGVLWSKLAINCTINTLGAVTGLKLGELLSNKKVRELFLSIYSEVIDVAHSKSITLEPITINPYRLYLEKEASWFKKFSKDIIVRVVGFKYRNIRSSTLQSIERGRKSEIDFLNGYVVEEAKKNNISVPVNQAITIIMKKIDNQELTYTPDNIDLLIQMIDENET